jgi:cell wall-associated NlpC family hydrolase
MKTKAILCLAACLLLPGCASTPETTTPPSNAEDVVVDAPSGAQSEVLLFAMAQLGIPYANGGETPNDGFDCSGLVHYVYGNAADLPLPRSTYGLVKVGRPVEAQHLQPGDLVFFNTMRRAYSHVGIYLGRQRFIHAPSSGGVVRIENMNYDYWTTRYNGARRVLPAIPAAEQAASAAQTD